MYDMPEDERYNTKPLRRRRLFMDILSNLVVFILMFNIFAFVYAAAYGGPPHMFLFFAIPFFALFVLRKKVKDIGIFLVAHIICLVLPFFIFDGLFIIVLATIFAAFTAAHSISCMLSKRERALTGGLAAAAVAIFTVSLLLLNLREEPVPGIDGLVTASAVITLGATGGLGLCYWRMIRRGLREDARGVHRNDAGYAVVA